MSMVRSSMTKWLYKSFVCESEELDDRLNYYGSEGWRLHTCEPVVVVGREGIGTLKFAVVMDKLTQDGEDKGGGDEDGPEAMAMKG